MINHHDTISIEEDLPADEHSDIYDPETIKIDGLSSGEIKSFADYENHQNQADDKSSNDLGIIHK